MAKLNPGVCSIHREQKPGCPACWATPAMVLGVGEEVWAQKVAEAEAAGLDSCRWCGFEQYRNHPHCVKCRSASWEGGDVNRR